MQTVTGLGIELIRLIAIKWKPDRMPSHKAYTLITQEELDMLYSYSSNSTFPPSELKNGKCKTNDIK